MYSNTKIGKLTLTLADSFGARCICTFTALDTN